MKKIDFLNFIRNFNFYENRILRKQKEIRFNPTHILKGNQGHKLSEYPIIFENGRSNVSIFRRDEKIFIKPNGSFVFINDSLKKGEVQLVVGDSIRFGDSSESLKVIRIES